MTEKKCTRCNLVKPLSEFGKSVNTGLFKSGQCRPCYARTQAAKYGKIRKEQHRQSLQGKKCKVCGSVIEDIKSKGKLYCSKKCSSKTWKYNSTKQEKAEYNRQWRLNNPEKYQASLVRQQARYKANGLKWRSRDPLDRQEERRRAAERKGKKYITKAEIINNPKGNDRWAVNACQAWRYWIKTTAPDWWLDAYYSASDRPWLDHRLSEAERYTCKYDNSPAFRAHEKERTRLYKFTHPETVAGWENVPGNRRRWNQAAISADGTVTKAVVRRLTVEKNCAYCYTPLNADNRQIDHVSPLSKGGAHSADNLVACCQPCNASKRAKKLWQWAGQMEGRASA